MNVKAAPTVDKTAAPPRTQAEEIASEISHTLSQVNQLDANGAPVAQIFALSKRIRELRNRLAVMSATNQRDRAAKANVLLLTSDDALARSLAYDVLE